MTNQNSNAQLSSLKNKLKNAKRRLRYWSGLSEFGEVYDPSTTNKNPNDAYNKALSECRDIAHKIYEITGVQPEVKNLKADHTPTLTKSVKDVAESNDSPSPKRDKARSIPPSVRSVMKQYGPGQRLPRGKARKYLA